MSNVTTRNLKLTHSLRRLLYRRNAAFALMAPGLALAGPSGEIVVGGEADIVRPDATRTVINQFTDRAAINWQTFSVDADEYVIFNQPDASSIVLNRVLGGDASYILGHMQSNGQVFLLNPNGVYFTHGASLDVQGFLASTLDMNPNDFMGGNFTLARSDSAPATARIINDGQITAGPGGYVVLAGDYTENTGIITANAGSIALVSGNALTLDIEGDGLVSFAVDEATLSDAAGVRNAGSLIADGGRVVMTAKVASDLVTTAVNNDGLVRAHSIEERAGEIHLVGLGGDVVNAGTLNADGIGADGGGIGIYSDRDVVLADGGVQTAAGDANRNGGVIRAVAEKHLDYQRNNIIRATGGNSGGFVEVSGHGSINLRGIPQIGPGGTFVIDPAVLNIGTNSGTSSVTIAQVAANLTAGVDVVLVASSSISAIAGSLNAAGGGDLTIGIGNVSAGTGSCGGAGGALCTGGVIFNQVGSGNINLSSLSINIEGNLLVDAGSGGTVSTTSLTTTGGNIRVFGGSITTGTVDASGGVLLGSSGDKARQVVVNGNLDAGTNIEVWTQDGSGLFIDINGNVSAGSNVRFNAFGSSLATGNVAVSGLISGGNIDIDAAGSVAGGNISINAVNATGNVTLDAMGGSAGGNINATAIDASGNVALTANGSGDSYGNITATTISASGSLAITAINNGGINAANINVGLLSGGSITVLADASAAASGGNVSFGGITPGFGNVNVTARGGTNSGGNISVSGDVSNRTGSMNFTASATGATGGNISAAKIQGMNLVMDATGGSISGGDINAGNIGVATGATVTTAGGTISGGNITLGDIAGSGDILLQATGAVGEGDIVTGNINTSGVAGGKVTILAENGDSHTFGNISARHIDAHFTPAVNGSVNVSMGALAVNGTAIAGRDIVVAVDANPAGGSNGSSIASITIESATAQNGAVDLRTLNETFNGDGLIKVNSGINAGGDVLVNQGQHGDRVVINGDIVANNFLLDANSFTLGGNIVADGQVNILPGILTISGQNISADSRFYIGASNSTGTVNFGIIRSADIYISMGGADIVTGTLEAINTAGLASITINATDFISGNGNITVNGDIVMEGRGNNAGDAARLTLETADPGNNITVTGNTSIITTAESFYINYEGPYSSGSRGAAQVEILAAGGSIDLGNVSMNAVGEGRISIDAATVNVGDMDVNVADGSLTRSHSLSSCGGTTCSLDVLDVVNQGGHAYVEFRNTALPGGATLAFGNVTMSAGDAVFGAMDYATIEGGAMTLAAHGNGYTYSSTGTFGGDTINFTGTGNGGGAVIDLAGTSGAVVALNGAVALSGRGTADLRITADTIKLRNVELDASAGTFERTGTPASGIPDGPFASGGGVGPRIDEGKIKGGAAHVSLSGYNASPSFGPVSADTVGVNGTVSVTGAGQAGVEIHGDNVTVSGNISATATRGQQDGTFASIDSGMSVSGTVVSDWGNAHVDIAGSGDVRLANVSITGPAASGHIEGVNVRAGAIDVTATGGKLHVVETRVVSGNTETLEFDGPNFITGVGLHADNMLELMGNFTLNAVGAGGALLRGSTIKTRDININVANGGYSVKTPELFNGVATDFTAGNAILGIVGATAQVNGDIAITAGRRAHFGGAANVSGDFSIDAGTGITRTIPATVQFLNRLDSEDDDASIVLPTAFDVHASNIDLATLAGPLALNGAALRASNALTLATGGNMSVSGVTFSGTTVRMNAGGNINNSNPAGSITADALAIFAGGNVNLANTVLTVGSGDFADITGDALFLRLLAAENLAAPTAGPSLAIRGRAVSLGTVSVAGDYILLETDALQINGTVSTSDPDLLLQVAPFAIGTRFGFEQKTGTGTSYAFNGTLDKFNAATIALGTTSHTGDVFIGRNGGVDIGDTNLFVLTSGNIAGLERVTSTGIVKDLFTLMNGEFDVPQTNEIDTSQDVVLTLNDQYALDDGGTDEEEEGDEEGEDTDSDAGAEEDDDSLIRQDTVDEEMMCR